MQPAAQKELAPWVIGTYRTQPLKIRPPPPPYLKWLVNPAVPLVYTAGVKN